MARHFHISLLITLVISTFSVYSALAEINLRWSPGDTTIVSPGGTDRLSLYIDDVINLRTVEVTVTYDTTVVKSLGGGPGNLYVNSGYFVFDGFEEEPGSWHGFAIVMGAGEYITGPGELFYWDIEGLVEGISPVVTVEAILYDEASPPNLIPDVFLGDATIIVGDPLSAVMEIPTAGIPFQVAPNPFNPRTRLSFDLKQSSYVHLAVFNARGHQVAVLHNGQVSAGEFNVDWQGTDDAGRSQPGGTYFFRLETNTGNSWTKGLLLK